MTVRFALIACLLASGTAPAFAQDNSTAPATTATPPVKEKKICRSDTDTGSIMPKTICHTKAAWADIDAANAAEANQFSDANRRHSGGFGH
jgi:hypothetical protein